MRTILLIIAILLVLGALPTWPYSADWGYYPSGGLLVVLLILIVFVLLRRATLEHGASRNCRSAFVRHDAQDVAAPRR